MEEHGLIHREVFRQAPPRVEYAATEFGLSLESVLLALCNWGRRHAEELNELDRLTDCRPSTSQSLLNAALANVRGAKD